MLLSYRSLRVPISQRLNNEATRCTRGISSDAVFFFPFKNVTS